MRNDYTVTVVLMPRDMQLRRRLGLPDWHQPQDREGVLWHYISGYWNDAPVLSSSSVPNDRLVAVDLGSFMRLDEAVTTEGGPVGPVVNVKPLDDATVDEILSRSHDATGDRDNDERRRRRLMSQVLVSVDWACRATVLDSGAARSVWLPESQRG